MPFATLDPPGSRDLDQAFHLERAGRGYTVRYAIADVPGFVSRGAVDVEARRRGQTLYAADGSIPLHPRVLSEDRASLLPEVDRPLSCGPSVSTATAPSSVPHSNER